MTEILKTGCAYIERFDRTAQWDLTGYPHEQSMMGDVGEYGRL